MIPAKKLHLAMADEKEQIKTLTDQVATLTSEKEALTLENSKLKTQVADQDKALEQATAVVADLKTQLAEKKVGVIELPTVKLGNDTYELVGGDFFYAGREISIEVLKEEPKLVKELVAEKVANLRKLVK